MAAIRIGISGWRYPPWRGIFYPDGLPQRAELEFAASCFSTIEINGSFYSLQSPASYGTWSAAVPRDFVFSIKAPRFITHIKRLRDIEGPLANFLASGVLRLGAKAGPHPLAAAAVVALRRGRPRTIPFEPARVDPRGGENGQGP